MTVMSNEDPADPSPYEPPVRGSVDHAEWLGDKLHCTNDYGKEAAFMLVEQAKALDQMRNILWGARDAIEALDGTNVENEKLVDSYRHWLQSLNSLPLPQSRVQPVVATGTEAQVCRDIATRQAHGIAKYGTTVDDNPLTQQQWLQHMYEELLDGAVYAKRLMNEMQKLDLRNLDMSPLVDEVNRTIKIRQEMLTLLPLLETWMKGDLQAVSAMSRLKILIHQLPAK